MPELPSASIRNESGTFRVPIDYFATHPRFDVGTVPYTNEPLFIVDQDDNVIGGTYFDQYGRVVGLPAD